MSKPGSPKSARRLPEKTKVVGAKALARRLRNASLGTDQPEENRFSFRSAQDRAEYRDLIDAGEALQPDFLKKQRILQTSDYVKFRRAEGKSDGSSSRRQKAVSAHERVTRIAWIAFFLTLLLGVASFAIVSLALNRKPFSKTCSSASVAPSPSQ